MKKTFFDVISGLPLQFSEALDATNIKISPRTKDIIFCGLGGSALPADLLKSYLAAAAVDAPEILVIKDYSFPGRVDKKWRGFFCSYSGNTAETLNCLKEALALRSLGEGREQIGMKEIIILAHGGELQKIAEEKGYPFVQIPDTAQPRLSYAYVLGAMLKILADSKLIKINFNELNADIEKCVALKDKIDEHGKALAQKLKGKTPLIYSSNKFSAISQIWKINFNENAKIPAFCNVFPELCHNEMVGFTNSAGNYQAIILKDENDSAEVKKMMDVFKQTLNGKLDVEIINTESGSNFFKMITCLWLGLWTSYHLAILNNVDPEPVVLVEEFKKKMAE
ncbi:MAG: bifunctional phosphoglucose/phosphomannose isomerase [Parcubacteria group bacterium]